MHAVVEMCVFYYCAVNWRNKVDIYSDRHNAQMLFNTYEDRAIVAEYIRKSGRNVHCRGRGTISSWNHAVTLVSTERKEHVWNRRISQTVD